MKTKQNTFGKFQIIPKSALIMINGGNKEEEEYTIIYLNGVPYRIRINKNGAQISAPERVL